MSAEQLLAKYPVTSDQLSRPALLVVLRELEKVLAQDVSGDVTEFGCYIGTASLFIRRLLDAYGSTKKYYAYDSFEGLPQKTIQDTNAAGTDFKAGGLAVSKKQFLQEFKKAGLQPPITHKAWFNALSNEQLPSQISFAFLDGDFYGSILISLQLVWPRLAPGAAVVIDDYGREALPGVELAVLDFFQPQQPFVRQEQGVAVIPK